MKLKTKKIIKLIQKGDFDFNEMDEILKYANQNGLLRPTLRKIGTLDESSEYFSVWSEHSQYIEHSYFSALKLLEKIASVNGPIYSIIKACNLVEHIPRDIDVYVRLQDKHFFIELLRKFGYCVTQMDRIETKLEHPSYHKIDIYSGGIHYFDHLFIDDDFLMDNTVSGEVMGYTLPVLNPESEYIMNLIHSIFGHTRVTLLDVLHFRRMIDDEFRVSISYEYAKRMGWGEIFIESSNIIKTLLNDINSDQIVIYPYTFPRELYFKWGFSFPSLSNKGKIALVVSYYWDYYVSKFLNTNIFYIIRSNNLLRGIFNSIGNTIREVRGDDKS